MKKYNVNVTPHAEKMLSQIFEYIAFELLEPVYAANQVKRLQDGILSLDIFPTRCRVFSNKLYPGHECRRLLVDNFSIFYFIDEDQVVITDILYSRSDIMVRLQNQYQ